MRRLAQFARSGIDEVTQIPSAPPIPASSASAANTDDIEAEPRLTPDMMFENLSKSFVVPVSGYYYDVGEAVFRALMEKTKEVVDLVRPHPDSPGTNMDGELLHDRKLSEQVSLKRRELEDWMDQLYAGAKQERIRSRLRYERRAERWKRMWDGIVRDGKNEKEVLKKTAAPLVDEVLVEYIKLNPRKRPFPGAPAPRLPFENEDDKPDQVLINCKTSRLPHQREPIHNDTATVDSIATQSSDSSDVGHELELEGPGKHKNRHAGLIDIMRKALIVNPGTGAVEPKIAKKGIIDGAHDDSPSSKSAVSSTSSLDERSHGLPDGAHDHDYHEEHEGSLLEMLRSDEGHNIHISQHGVEVPHKTVLKHPHMELDVNGKLVDLSAKRLNDTHVRIVTPREEQ